MSARAPHATAPRVADLYAFMVRREELRIRKDVDRMEAQWWTSDAILREYKFTNVCRCCCCQASSRQAARYCDCLCTSDHCFADSVVAAQ